MIQNIGGFDKISRIVIGLAIIIIGIASKSFWGALGLVPIITAFIGWCPIYTPFGITTCKTKGRTTGDK